MTATACYSSLLTIKTPDVPNNVSCVRLSISLCIVIWRVDGLVGLLGFMAFQPL